MKFIASEAELLWHGEYPADVVARVRADFEEGLKRLPAASKLIVHTVFLSTDFENGPCVIAWGEENDDRIHCEYIERPEWISISDFDEVPFQ